MYVLLIIKIIIKILLYFLQVKIFIDGVSNIKIKYICIKIFEKNCFFSLNYLLSLKYICKYIYKII